MNDVLNLLWKGITLPFKLLWNLMKFIPVVGSVLMAVEGIFGFAKKGVNIASKGMEMTFGSETKPRPAEIDLKLVQTPENGVEKPLETDKFKKWFMGLSSGIASALVVGMALTATTFINLATMPWAVPGFCALAFSGAFMYSYSKNKKQEQTRAKQALQAKTFWGKTKQALKKNMPLLLLTAASFIVAGPFLMNALGLGNWLWALQAGVSVLTGASICSSIAKQTADWQNLEAKHGPDFLQKADQEQQQTLAKQKENLPPKTFLQKTWPYLKTALVLGLCAVAFYGPFYYGSTAAAKFTYGAFLKSSASWAAKALTFLKMPSSIVSALGLGGIAATNHMIQKQQEKQMVNSINTQAAPWQSQTPTNEQTQTNALGQPAPQELRETFQENLNGAGAPNADATNAKTNGACRGGNNVITTAPVSESKTNTQGL